MTTRIEQLSLEAQKKIIERLNRIEQNFDRIFDSLDDLKGGINRHDQTLYETLVEPKRNKEDKNGR